MLLHLLLIIQQSIAEQPDSYERLLDEQKIIRRLLEEDNSDYDWRVRPRGSLNPTTEESPVNVAVNMYLRSISKVDDVNMEYSMHFTFREEWVDERLLFHSDSLSHIVLSPGQKIWLPDTFFQNEKDGKKHNIDTPNIMIRVYNSTGKILYSCRTRSCNLIRDSLNGDGSLMTDHPGFLNVATKSVNEMLTLTLSCPMQLNDYPLDMQRCYIDYASYAYTTQDIVYHWKKERPIQIKDGLRQSLPSFLLSDVRTGNCTSVTNTGTYSCLRTIIELKREFSYYLLQLYIPSFMLVAVSWVSFWLDKDSVPARVTLGVTTLLTMTTQASGVNANLPPVSYTKAIDIWIGVCLAFIFGALLEFALVNWAARQDLIIATYRNRHQAYFLMRQMDWNTPNEMRESRTNNHYSWWRKLWDIKYKERSRRIDLLSRVLFPACFILFNITYWWRYLRPYMAVRTVM